MSANAERDRDRVDLLAHLDAQRARGRRVPCLDLDARARGMWTSESDAEQQMAARLCAGCSAATTCGLYGLAHPKEFGVYGGLTNAERQPVSESRAGETAAIGVVA